MTFVDSSRPPARPPPERRYIVVGCPGMARRLFNIASALSSLFCLMVALLWAHSSNHNDSIWARPAPWRVGVASGSGHVVIVRITRRP